MKKEKHKKYTKSKLTKLSLSELKIVSSSQGSGVALVQLDSDVVTR